MINAPFLYIPSADVNLQTVTDHFPEKSYDSLLEYFVLANVVCCLLDKVR